MCLQECAHYERLCGNMIVIFVLGSVNIVDHKFLCVYKVWFKLWHLFSYDIIGFAISHASKFYVFSFVLIYVYIYIIQIHCTG